MVQQWARLQPPSWCQNPGVQYASSCSRARLSASKIIATVFWNAKDMILVDLLKRGSTIKAESTSIVTLKLTLAFISGKDLRQQISTKLEFKYFCHPTKEEHRLEIPIPNTLRQLKPTHTHSGDKPAGHQLAATKANNESEPILPPHGRSVVGDSSTAIPTTLVMTGFSRTPRLPVYVLLWSLGSMYAVQYLERCKPL
ncbi:hypothetical protein J6590_090796 [Homalodisca vitripennis]|nr:hypothetical protein J6590_090796 [Homalodisca vitripennis]